MKKNIFRRSHRLFRDHVFRRAWSFLFSSSKPNVKIAPESERQRNIRKLMLEKMTLDLIERLPTHADKTMLYKIQQACLKG